MKIKGKDKINEKRTNPNNLGGGQIEALKAFLEQRLMVLIYFVLSMKRLILRT